MHIYRVLSFVVEICSQKVVSSVVNIEKNIHLVLSFEVELNSRTVVSFVVEIKKNHSVVSFVVEININTKAKQKHKSLFQDIKQVALQ